MMEQVDRERPILTPQERDQVRRWLEHGRDRLIRATDRENAEAGDLLRRRGERDPCAQLSPASTREDMDLVERSRRASENAQALHEIEEALRRLEEEPGQVGICSLCESSITMERLELVPTTRFCGSCASSR